LLTVSTERLFVYGSLKRNGRHHSLMAAARFVAEAVTIAGFELERVGEYWALVPRPGSTSTVPGELFDVGGELLAALDEFEGEGYERGRVPVVEMAQAESEARLALAYLKKSR
jgi:gamma-glutamylcyclotransferase (GGCT)/AIG2-like uncharacterized protein YtfP